MNFHRPSTISWAVHPAQVATKACSCCYTGLRALRYCCTYQGSERRGILKATRITRVMHSVLRTRLRLAGSGCTGQATKNVACNLRRSLGCALLGVLWRLMHASCGLHCALSSAACSFSWRHVVPCLCGCWGCRQSLPPHRACRAQPLAQRQLAQCCRSRLGLSIRRAC